MNREELISEIWSKNWSVVGPELKRLREFAGATAEDLASHMAVTAPTIFRWESGKVSIPTSKCLRLLSILMESGVPLKNKCGQITLLSLEDILKKGYSAVTESNYDEQVIVLKSIFNGTGKKIKEVSEKLDIEATYLSKVINGRQRSPKKVLKVLDFFSTYEAGSGLLFPYYSSFYRDGNISAGDTLAGKIDSIVNYDGDLRIILRQAAEAGNPINGNRLIELVFHHIKTMSLLT